MRNLLLLPAACRQFLQRDGRCDDIDLPERVYLEQVSIAGDDHVGVRGDGAGDHGIVVGIAWHGAGDDRRRDGRGQQAVALHDGGLGEVVRGEMRDELVAGEHVGEFGQQGAAGVEPEAVAVLGDVHDPARWSTPEQRGNHRVGVEHDPHQRLFARRSARTASTSA